MNHTNLRWVLTFGTIPDIFKQSIIIKIFLTNKIKRPLTCHLIRNDSGCEEYLYNRTATIPETCSLVMEGCLMVSLALKTTECGEMCQLVATGGDIWTAWKLLVYQDPVNQGDE